MLCECLLDFLLYGIRWGFDFESLCLRTWRSPLIKPGRTMRPSCESLQRLWFRSKCQMVTFVSIGCRKMLFLLDLIEPNRLTGIPAFTSLYSSGRQWMFNPWLAGDSWFGTSPKDNQQVWVLQTSSFHGNLRKWSGCDHTEITDIRFPTARVALGQGSPT